MIVIREAERFLSIRVENGFALAVFRRQRADFVLDGVQRFHVEQRIFFRGDLIDFLSQTGTIFEWRFVIVNFFLNTSRTRCTSENL